MINKMKATVVRIIVAVAAGLAVCGVARAADSFQPQPAPQVTVQVESEVAALAKGYAEAFSELPSGAKYVVVQGKNGPVYMGSIHSIKALGGVLLIQTDGGLYHAISAESVVSVTNEKQKAKE